MNEKIESELQTDSILDEKTRRRNELAIEIADILNSYGDIDEVKKSLLNIQSIKTNVERKQKSKKDWETAILNAMESGVFPSHCYLSAQNWGCCAVGARLQIEAPDIANDFATKKYDYDPKKYLTKEAWNLGYSFYRAITDNEPEKAQILYEKIQSLPRVLKTKEELTWYDLPWYKRLVTPQKIGDVM